MVPYLLVNDIHLADRPPSSCTDTYTDDLFDLLREVGDLAVTPGASAVILAGDVFHFKTPGRTTHRTLIRLINTLRHFPCPVLVVPGNHDLQHDRLDSLYASQPLGVLLASGAATLLDAWSAVDAGIIPDPVYGVPWLQTFDDASVSAALASWRGRLDRTVPGLVVTHAPLYPPGQELPYENYPTVAFADAMDNHGFVHYGHVHEPHGIYHVAGVTFSNPGALSRGSLHEHNLTRPVQVASWDPANGEFTHHQIPHRPAADVFRLAEIGAAKAEQRHLEEFINSITNTRLEITSTEAVLDHLRGLNLPTDLETLCRELLTQEATG